MRQVRIILAALLAVALLAGCGGGSDDAFKRDYKSVNDQLLELGDTVGQALQNAPRTSDAMLAGEFSGFATQLDQVRRRIDGLKPPGELRPKVDSLATVVATLSKDLRDIAHAATVHDPAGARQATEALVRDSRAARDARRALARKTGARVGP